MLQIINFIEPVIKLLQCNSRPKGSKYGFLPSLTFFTLHGHVHTAVKQQTTCSVRGERPVATYSTSQTHGVHALKVTFHDNRHTE